MNSNTKEQDMFEKIGDFFFGTTPGVVITASIFIVVLCYSSN